MYIWVNIGSGNGLVPDGTKLLPEPMLSGVTWHWPESFYSEHPGFFCIIGLKIILTKLLLRLPLANWCYGLNQHRFRWWQHRYRDACQISERYDHYNTQSHGFGFGGKTSYRLVHYNDVIMSFMAPQIYSLMIVYSIVYSGADQRKHQGSASLAFVRGIHRWIHRTNGQWREKCFHLMTSSWNRGPENNFVTALFVSYVTMHYKFRIHIL